MQSERSSHSNPLGLVAKSLGSPLEPGNLGIIMGRAGVGKTAFLTHIALEHMIQQGKNVLHVCIDELPEKIKVWYGEFLKNLAPENSSQDVAALQHRVEPMRFIMAYLHHTFTPSKLGQGIVNLKEQANFRPSLVILDGLDFDHVKRSDIEEIRSVAIHHSVALWMSARTHRHISTTNEKGVPYPCHEMDDLFDAMLFLEPEPDLVRVKIVKHGEHYHPTHAEVALNPQTYLIA